jgi:hypothetical protein
MDQKNHNSEQITSMSEKRMDEMQSERLDDQQLVEGISQKYDEETSAEVSPKLQGMNQPSERPRSHEKVNEGANEGKGWGIASIVLSILSFFFWSYLLAPAGIILGIIAIRKGSRVGWWAIAVGVVALIVAIVLLPFRLIF